MKDKNKEIHARKIQVKRGSQVEKELDYNMFLSKNLSIKLRDWVRKNRYSLIGCIHQLKNIQCRKTGQNWILSKALTKKQKEISEILKLPVHSLDVRK